MNSNCAAIKKILDDISELEKKLCLKKEELGELSRQVNAKDFDELEYDEMKIMHEKICGYMTENERARLNELLFTKKMEKYPELQSATYFPEINTLNISDKEKLELDRFARKNCRIIFYANRFTLGTYGHIELSWIDMLLDLGILEKMYEFRIYGENMRYISNSEFEKYKRYWDLLDRRDHITNEEVAEMERLDENGYCCLYLSDEIGESEYFREICSEKDLNSFKEDGGSIEVYYRFIKKPDLTYEKL